MIAAMDTVHAPLEAMEREIARRKELAWENELRMLTDAQLQAAKSSREARIAQIRAKMDERRSQERWSTAGAIGIVLALIVAFFVAIRLLDAIDFRRNKKA